MQKVMPRDGAVGEQPAITIGAEWGLTDPESWEISATEREEVTRTARELARRHMQARAIAEYQKIVDGNPDEVDALLEIASLRREVGEYSEAFEAYELAAHRSAEIGERVEAIGIWRAARDMIAGDAPELGDRYPDIECACAELYDQMGRAEEARVAYERAAVRLHRAGRYLAEGEVLQKLVDRSPDDPAPRARLGEAMVRHGDVHAALAELAGAAELYLDAHDRASALRVYERMLFLNPDPYIAREAAELQLAMNRPGDGLGALAKVHTWMKMEPDNWDILPVLVRALRLAGQTAKAQVIEELIWNLPAAAKR